MIHNRKLTMIKTYNQRLKTKRILDLYSTQEANYASYFAGDQQQQQEKQAKQELPEEDPEEEEEVEDQEEEFSVADYIQLLSHQEREAFKQENPQLPPLFFMTKAEKKRYFEEMNRTFQKVIARTPQRKTKTKKILKFRNEFEVKHFDEKQKVVALTKSKEVKEPYQQKIHFS